MGFKGLTRSVPSVPRTTSYFDMNVHNGVEGGGEGRRGRNASIHHESIDHHIIEMSNDRVCPLVACLFVLLRSLLRNSLLISTAPLQSTREYLRASFLPRALDIFFTFNIASTLYLRMLYLDPSKLYRFKSSPRIIERSCALFVFYERRKYLYIYIYI